ncbi:MAG TPA: diguanylate cyclase, partial [Acidimicrobiales bacterium]|nr:diguanylate cyclase [Acidimicrobiales bacterium]
AAHFKAVVESSHDAIISKDLSGIITSWNAGAEHLFGYSAAEVIGKPVAILATPGRDDEVSDLLRRVRTGAQVDDFETVKERKDGSQVEVSLTMSPMRDRSGRIFGASTIARDISERLRYQEQLRRLAEHDPLTGLRNRRRFERDIDEQVGRARRYGEQATLLVIDLNGFKRINDTFGHRNGDRALKAVSAALKSRLRETDVVARLGGDEFAILLPYSNTEQGTIIAEDLRRTIDECSIDLEGIARVQVTASVGIVQIDGHTESQDEIMAEADRLMYLDKRTTARPSLGEEEALDEAFAVHFGPDGWRTSGR